MDPKNRFSDKKMEKGDDNFCLNYWKIFDISLFSRGMNEVLNIINGWIESKARRKWVATVNSEFVIKATKDVNFKKMLMETDLNVMDGVGLIWAKELNDRRGSRFLNGVKVGMEILNKKHKGGLVPGVDLMLELCKLAGEKEYKVFFLGGFENRAERTAKFFKSKFLISNDKLAWSSGGPEFNNEEVLEKINKFKPDILFVAYGMKKQEEWIRDNLDKADFGVAIGVGRSFDYYSGDLKRAPEAWRKMGIEWLYSLIKEPKRLKRQLELPKFVWKVLKN